MTQPTAVPWGTQETGDGFYGMRVVGPGGGELCRAAKGNAQLIVRAVNCHALLLAACEAALPLAYLAAAGLTSTNREAGARVRDQIEAAIKAAHE